MMKKSTIIFSVISALLVSMTSIVQVSHAQSSADATVLEEIVVTARKRSENLRDVPASVVAFTETDIERANITSARDFVNLTPNVSIVETQNIAFSFVNIRGLSQVRNVDPTVAVVVDGILQTTSLGFSRDLFDVQQIEVLKGPQGARTKTQYSASPFCYANFFHSVKVLSD